ncbi:glycoside hydrolase family 116 protein [Microbacterium elymi]|uniref:Glycoside hydrolase family 116 protein n=2 Tax=Microbacterium elymi TaxID=2909587 RepID=A0ABY3STQ1_9MICO|nr:glycoside hydrolase family 116 protein [Microbacterium elymi]UJP13822.2 glycoside hydrolase family 116 protein [Microbacterium elymi]
MLIAALRAGARMARHVGDGGRAVELTAHADRAAARMDEVLWNGQWYRQVIDDLDGHRYQYGEGVLSDQLLGQFHAQLNGLDDILPADRVRTALSAIMTHNFRGDLTDHESTQRVYALNDEGGLLLASWPAGGRPAIPFVYSDEVWTGVEHQVAASLAAAGLVEDALLIERTRAARYDGVVRNPWNEIECGNHYARSLASWGVLLAFTGQRWDAPTHTLGFAPAQPGPLRALFTTGTGWGRVEIDADALTLRLDGGELALAELRLSGTVVGVDIHLSEGDAHIAPLT